MVETLGLPQYLLIPILLLWTLGNLIFARRETPKLLSLGAPVCIAIGTIAGALMFHREYFSSLGW